LTNASKVKECLSTIKGIDAQLSSLALESLDQQAQAVFHQAMLTVEQIKQDLQVRLLEIELKNHQTNGLN
jgi:hypothetical protein